MRNNEAPFSVRRHDVIRFRTGGGGGLGDPLLRTPQEVHQDVRNAYITVDNARAAYGVVVDSAGELDATKTRELREAIRRERIGKEPTSRLAAPADPGCSIAVGVDAGRSRSWRCASCDARLSDVGDNWRLGDVVMRQTAIQEMFECLGMRVRGRERDTCVVAREYFCGHCAAALATDVTMHDSPVRPAPRLTEPPA